MKKLFALLTICLFFACSGDSEKSSGDSETSSERYPNYEEEHNEQKKNLIGSWDVFENGDEINGSMVFYADGTALLKDKREGDLAEYYIRKDLLCFSKGQRKDMCGAIEWISDDSFRWENERGWFIIRRN